MNTEIQILLDENNLNMIRESVKKYLTDKRYIHTLAVEKEVTELGKIYFPGDSCTVLKLRCAALLHDITKNLSLEKQLQYCQKFDIMVRNGEELSPKIFHAKTGAELAREEFPFFVDEEIISGIRWHTTGRRNMTVFQCLVYLADYIEETRTFADCVTLRDYFYSEISKENADKDHVLVSTMIMSFNMTMRNLIEESALIDSDTVEARNYFIEILKGMER